MRESRRVEIVRKIEALKRTLKLDQKTLTELGSFSLLGQLVFLALMNEMVTDTGSTH